MEDVFMSHALILLFMSILPVIIILYFVYHKDKNKESFKLLFLFFLCGLASCSLVLEISTILKLLFPSIPWTPHSTNLLITFSYAFLGVALIEEICKWIMVYFIGYHHHEFEELYDITVYAVFVSLGFACYENIMCVMQMGELKTAFLRAISAVPAHACDAVFMGYYLSIAKKYYFQKNKKLERKNIYLSILVPTILHGIYDFCLFLNYHIFIFFFVLFITYLYTLSLEKLKEMSESNIPMPNSIDKTVYKEENDSKE